MAAISEAIHPSFAEYFRNKLDEGRLRYEKRLEQGFDEPPPAVRSEDRELETRLSLALLKILPAKMKTHALERGNTLDGISVAALLEAIYEQMTPGGIREKNSLLQYLRSPPASNTGEELTATLRRYRLAQQRAKHLDIPQQAAHETIAALDTMVRPLERKHQPLSVRLGILRLQSNIQIPTIDGVELYLKILEAEAIKLQAEDISKPKNAKADSEEYHIPNANQAAAGGKGGSRLCGFFNTARGCLKGAACEFRHETAGTGKGAKGSEKGGGKAGEPKGKPKAAAKAEAKAEAKAAAKAQAKAVTEAAIAAEAKAEAKRRAKADKKAAKAAAKAAAAAASSTQATAATIVEDAIPFLAGASPNASSSDHVPRASMAHEDAESEVDFEEETEVISLAGADPPEEEGFNSDDNHGISDVEGIQMHAEASTPEWSDVEQGQFPSPATTPRSDSEIEFIGAREPPAPLWVLDLTLSDYVAWTRQGHVQSYAHRPFEQEINPNSIMWPTWWTIASDQLSDDEDGTIHVVDEVCMLRCTTTMVLFEDGIIRPVFVVWLLEKVSGRERMAALIREQSRPIVRPWPAQELSKAAPPKTKGWPKAKMPTVPTPKGTFGDAAHAYVHAEKASSSSSGHISGLAHTLERAQTDASEARPKASAAVPKASTAVPKASTAVPKASAAVPKASTAVPKASAVAIRESPGSDDSGSEISHRSPSIAMRCMYFEEENIDEIPALVGIEPDTIVPKCWKHRDHEDEPTLAGVGQILSKAHRLECTDQPAVNIVASQQQPAVLVDSGANETIRPWDETINEAGCKRTSVVTASGDRVSALRTKDGELCIKSNGESRDWLLSVRRLVEAGGTFGWTQNGAEVTFRDHEGSEQRIKCHIINGLPFLDWTEFKPIRILLSKHHKSQGGTVHKAAAADPQWRSCETCTMEELCQTMWREETYQAVPSSPELRDRSEGDVEQGFHQLPRSMGLGTKGRAKRTTHET